MGAQARFISKALYTKRPVGARRFHVSRPLVFYSALLGRTFIVPVGFETDFASIPWFLQSLIQVNGKHIHAAVLHDMLCEFGDVLGISQKQADQVFLEAMEALGVRVTQRRVMYRGVRMYQSSKGFISTVVGGIYGPAKSHRGTRSGVTVDIVLEQQSRTHESTVGATRVRGGGNRLRDAGREHRPESDTDVHDGRESGVQERKARPRG